MPEARDRLSRAEHSIATYRPRLRSITLGGNAGRVDTVFFVSEDEPESAQGIGTPFRWRDTMMTGARGTMGVPAASPGITRRSGGGRGVVGRGNLGTPRIGRGWNVNASRVGQENRSPPVGSGQGRGSGSVLPSWYPRTPLRDITSVVRAIERRSRLREGEGLQTGSPILQDQPVHYPFLSTPGAPLKHNISMISPNPTIGTSCSASIGKVPKLLLDIANKKDEDSGCLTPQKMLLNSIDKVEKVVMEELRKLKRTPSARKAEREKRVRTLMSMR
ncbi:Protein POLYCHOME [Forsythia ovata]|uniref:Protein POLYCHOME n=1 Tax=Forsythia ovata TaxID=205694 RepID=A0ABD1PLB6_9LAMI